MICFCTIFCDAWLFCDIWAFTSQIDFFGWHKITSIFLPIEKCHTRKIKWFSIQLVGMPYCFFTQTVLSFTKWSTYILLIRESPFLKQEPLLTIFIHIPSTWAYSLVLLHVIETAISITCHWCHTPKHWCIPHKAGGQFKVTPASTANQTNQI
jgi:hypothetical protein